MRKKEKIRKKVATRIKISYIQTSIPVPTVVFFSFLVITKSVFLHICIMHITFLDYNQLFTDENISNEFIKELLIIIYM